MTNKNLENYLSYLSKWIKEKVEGANAKGVILGLSGGIDSAVAAVLAKNAFPHNTLALIMPCHSNQQDQHDALLVIQKFKIKNQIINLDNLYDNFVKDNPSENNLAKGNLKARLRMITLYYYAQVNNYLVLGTDNYDEWHTGYFTKFGDGAADLVPLIHLIKSEVFAAAKILDIPEEIINKNPTAGLFGSQTDEEELKVTYNILDSYLKGEKVSDSDKQRIEYLHKISEHKRNLPVKPSKLLER